MKIYDDVKLNTELEDLARRGIHKGCAGIVFEIIADTCFVVFLNNLNHGDYACCNVRKQHLDFVETNTPKMIKDLEKFKATRDLTKDFFKPQKFFEYDLVELAVEKEKYAKEGVHKGDRGAVMEPYCIDSCYYVIFSEKGTGQDIADISVYEDDLILVTR